MRDAFAILYSQTDFCLRDVDFDRARGAGLHARAAAVAIPGYFASQRLNFDKLRRRGCSNACAYYCCADRRPALRC